MKLQVPTKEDCEKVRIWRNEVLETLRTPYSLTAEQQEDFYKKVICNRNSNHRYWSIYDTLPATSYEDKILDKKISFPSRDGLVGFCGLTFIEWENSQAEISLIIDPKMRGKGLGEKAVELILDQAFNYLNLELVYGECYCSNQKGVTFWHNVVKSYDGHSCTIRKGKYWQGTHYSTFYFDITKDEFNKKNK